MKIKHQYTFIIIILIILLLNGLGLFEAINEKIYNNYIILNQKKDQNKDIVIVGIDNPSLEVIGKWPWPRSNYLKFLDIVTAGYPKALGIYISFTESDKYNPGVDQILNNRLKKIPNVFISSKQAEKRDSKGNIAIVPLQSIFTGIKEGHTLLATTPGGMVNRFPPKRKIPAFSILAVQTYLDNLNIDTPLKSNEKLRKFINNYNTLSEIPGSDRDILIDYRRTPDKFLYYSYLDVINYKIPEDAFKNKIVLLGIVDKFISTGYNTPFTGSKAVPSGKIQTQVTGVELQAQIIDSLLNFRGLTQYPDWFIYYQALFLALIFYFSARNKTILIQGIFASGFLLLLGLTNYGLFTYYAFWFPPALPAILILTIFGINLYTTTSNVDNELIKTFSRIQNEQNMPLIELPSDFSSRAETLTSLLDIINNNRLTTKAIMDGVNNGIIVIDNEGNISWANGRVLNLFTDSLILNQPLETLIDDLNFESILQEVNKSGVFKKEIAIGNLEFYCVISEIATNPVQYVAVFNDITELKQINRLKTDMVRMVSHELKNPLTAIQICAENISFIEDRNIVVDNANNIISSTELLIDTINNFLNLSRLENNMVEINIEKKDLLEVINKSISINKPVADSKKIMLIVEAQEIPPILIDTKQILVVINNLISNAIKYSHPEGKIVIKVELEQDFVKTSVIDNGIGIPEEDLNRVFDKFFRSINNKKNNIEGTGLGLAIIKTILDIHNGDINVTSEYGRGSCFTFYLPAATELVENIQVIGVSPG